MGPSNAVAVSAVRAVIAGPGRKYNPLVLAGRSGLGKTHLLNALGLELAARRGAVVAGPSRQGVIDGLIAAIHANRDDRGRAPSRPAAALAVDGIPLPPAKERTPAGLFPL